MSRELRVEVTSRSIVSRPLLSVGMESEFGRRSWWLGDTEGLSHGEVRFDLSLIWTLVPDPRVERWHIRAVTQN